MLKVQYGTFDNVLGFSHSLAVLSSVELIMYRVESKADESK